MTLPVSRWESQYTTAVLIGDLLVIAAACGVGVLFTAPGGPPVRTAAIAVLTAFTIVAALAIGRAWEPRVLGQGAEEFRRLGRGVAGAGIAVALAGLALNAPHVRPWVFGVVPGVLLAAPPVRYALRRVLHRRRRSGTCMLPVLAAGSIEEVADLIDRTRRETYNGWRIEAVCTPTGRSTDGAGDVCGVPVVGTLDAIPELVGNGGYRVVAITPDPYWTRTALRTLAWQLESVSAELVVAPTLMEVTGPRLHVTPVYGLPLLRVSKPTFAGLKWVGKNVLDRCLAVAGLVLAAPLLIAVAAAVKLEDRGPVLFRQTRIGKDGNPFTMVKFRSMTTDAEQRRAELVEAHGGTGPLFKLRQDPRTTRVGAVLRRFSLDELPQLFNVVRGDMSIVGPRPPLPEEVERYEYAAMRRLLVKPGLTGLWQVSGRSDLTWDETVRLDLRYVENWSFALDLVILWKTAGAVIHGRGAY